MNCLKIRNLLYCALAVIPLVGEADRGDIRSRAGKQAVKNVRSENRSFSIWCDDSDSLYECGETAVFNVRSSLTNGIAHVRLDNFGSKVLREFDVDLSKTREFTVEGGRDIPGFLLLTVTCGKTVKRWGAAFSPEKITGGAADITYCSFEIRT